MISVLCNCLAWGIHSVCDVQVSYPYPHLQQPAPLQGLPLHLVNGIDCENDLRNSGGLRCWLRLFSVQLCNYAVKRGYQGFIQGERGALIIQGEKVII